METKKLQLNVGGFLLIMLYYLLIGGLLFGFFTEVIPNPSNFYLKSITLIVKELIPSVGVIYVILLHIRINNEPDFKLSIVGDFNSRLLLSVLLVGLVFFFWFHNSIGIWSDNLPVGKVIKEIFRKMDLDLKENPVPVIINIAVFMPVFEEMLFRGIILRGFLGNYRPVMAIFLSALFFGMAHMNLPQFFHAFLIGLFLGIIYYRTQSLLLCVAVHSLNNGISFLVDSDKFQPGVMGFLIGIAVFSIGVYLFKKQILFKIKRADPIPEPASEVID